MRLVHAVATALLLTLLAAPGVAATPSSDHKAQRARVTISATPEWVKKGGIVTLTGTVKGVRGRVPVTIFQKTKGKSWVVEAVKRTSRKGRFTHREDVKSGDRTYKACVKRACDTVLVHMGQQPKETTAVSITGQSASTVEAGQAFTVAGAASRNLDGRTVEVQAYQAAAESWGVIGSAVVANGAWTSTTSLSTAGKSVPVRVAFPGGVGLKDSTSAAVSMTVYGWYYLSDRDRVDSLRFDDGSAFIAGTPYSHSVFNSSDFWWEAKPWGEWNLSYSCTTFDASIGLDDESETGFKVGFRSWADSVERSHGIMTTGQAPTRVTFDVTGVFRLRLQDEYVAGSSGSGSGYGWGVWGDARVLCAF